MLRKVSILSEFITYWLYFETSETVDFAIKIDKFEVKLISKEVLIEYRILNTDN